MATTDSILIPIKINYTADHKELNSNHRFIKPWETNSSKISEACKNFDQQKQQISWTLFSFNSTNSIPVSTSEWLLGSSL